VRAGSGACFMPASTGDRPSAESKAWGLIFGESTMGWQGAIRTLGAMARAAERDARRRAREQAQQLAALEKAEQREKAAEAVREFQSFMQSLVSVHKTCSVPIDWHARAAAPAPPRPQRVPKRENAAKRNLASYSPSLLSRILGRVEREKAELSEAIRAARAADETSFQEQLKAYEKQLAEYEDGKELAGRILARDTETMLEFIRALDPFSSVAQLGESLRIAIPIASRAEIELNIHGQEVIPRDTAKLLASGRLSLKPIPKSEYLRLYQDHVCSAALRVAREILAALPVGSVLVTAVDELLDSSTGNLSEGAILSLLAPRATVDSMNFDALDPSEAMRNFIHCMDFRATTGFRPIEPLDLAATEPAG